MAIARGSKPRARDEAFRHAVFLAASGMEEPLRAALQTIRLVAQADPRGDADREAIGFAAQEAAERLGAAGAHLRAVFRLCDARPRRGRIRAGTS